ncbi:MAG: amidohydrolase [Synergistaceae bacterium]|nr:amidohydrolase [Synergistaceae bacterium]
MERNMIKKLYRDVVVWDAERDSADRCDVVTEGDKILSIFPAGTLRSGCAYEGRGKTALIPGFVNAHGHAAMTLLRGLGEELPLMEWLQEKIWPVENNLDGDMVKKGTALAILEMLSTGTTCFADMYFYMDKVAEASLENGIRCGLSRGIVGDSDGSKLKENLRLARDYHGKEGLITVQLGPHAPYTVDFDLMKEIAAKAKEENLGVQLHWLETSSEWSISGQEGRMTPEEYLSETGMIDVPSLLLAHCVWVGREASSFYARENVTFAHNPKSNLKLGSGVAPLPDYLKAGVRVALGTDGAASNNRLDIWDELRCAAMIHKGTGNDPTLVTSAEALKMATVNGARALGFKDTGLIKEGYKADMILIDLDQPHYVGWDSGNLPGFLVYAGSSADVKATVVAGRVLYQNGSFTETDKDRVIAEAKAARRKLTGHE